ncbi:MAG: mercuric transporter MerT family protein [Gammaproteobacteria bacterium]
MSLRIDWQVFSSLSRQVMVSGGDTSPGVVLNQLLSNVVRHLGGNLVGHAKAIAHVNGGLFHASTTGDPWAVDVKAVGNPARGASAFRLDFMCVFHGLRENSLIKAWDESLAVLAASGLVLTPTLNTKSPRIGSTSRPPTAGLSIAGSLASSFLVLKPCCLIPVLWSVSGGGIGALQIFEPLEPYRPFFIAVTVVLLAVAFSQVYFRAPAVETESVRISVRRSRRILWLATVVFLFATVYPIITSDAQNTAHTDVGHNHE